MVLQQRESMRRMGLFGAAALVACALLAFRSAASRHVALELHGDFVLTGINERLSWVGLYYAGWIVLAPLIFASARWYPFRRDRWAGPLLVHGTAGVVVAGVSMVFMSAVFGELVLGEGWVSPSQWLTPRWLWLGAYHAVTDSLIYWAILAGGHGFDLYESWKRTRLQAAELEQSLAAAQVDSLKMKLQPHFLFNTLNSISFLALEGDTPAVGLMVERLASLLRASTSSNGQQWVTLAEELALLEQYLSIEEVRFKERLKVTLSVPPELRGVQVPSLVLQPIVENSIKHGFSKRLDASRLDIAVARAGDHLVVTVRDDGPGLPPGWVLETHCGRGLRNVIERLSALFGSGFEVSIENAPGGGALARLRMPIGPPAAAGTRSGAGLRGPGTRSAVYFL